MRELTLADGPPFSVHETPEDLAALTEQAARCGRIWMGTRLASDRRLSLVQLRLEDGSLHVVDILAPGMAAAYQQTLLPRVIAAPEIEKWAHYARFERRVFGPDVVRALNCTFELARSVPYHRLPLRSLRLDVLVQHLFGRPIDKTLQRTDWGLRPLSRQELESAAWDPEWCYRIHQQVSRLVHTWDAATDDPDEVQRRYMEILVPLRDAKQWRTAIWDTIKAFMVGDTRERFSDFVLQTQVIRTVPIRALAAAVAEVDPMGGADFAVAVPAALQEVLLPGGLDALRAVGRERVTPRFVGPRAPRGPGRPAYELDAADPEGVGALFASADHAHRTLESERQELRERMRAWMADRQTSEWGGFAITDSAPRLTADVRSVAEWLRPGEAPSTGLPARFLATFSGRQLAALSEYVDAAANPILRWRPDRSIVPVEVAQSRDWHGDDDDGS
jgi:ribonuclease D